MTNAARWRIIAEIFLPLALAMTGNDHSDDDIASLLRIGLDETQAGGPMPDWEPPGVAELRRALPQYEISGFIARGGMGAVYKGTQRALRRALLKGADVIASTGSAAEFHRGRRGKRRPTRAVWR